LDEKIEMKKTLLWLDDVRDPLRNDWLIFSPITDPIYDVVWVKSYKEFINWITENGLPTAICFDHDLADFSYNPEKGQEMVIWHEKTGMDCAKWLVDYCLDNKLTLPLYNIQSANPSGKDNIDGLLKNFIKYQNKNG
jgi:hypothetical protein